MSKSKVSCFYSNTRKHWSEALEAAKTARNERFSDPSNQATIISNQKETIQALKIQVRCLTKEMIEMENTIKSKVECIQKLVGIIAQFDFLMDKAHDKTSNGQGTNHNSSVFNQSEPTRYSGTMQLDLIRNTQVQTFQVNDIISEGAQVINVDDYSPDEQDQAEVKLERPETPPPFMVVETAHANTPNRIDSPSVLGRSPRMIGHDEHEIDNIETIHLDESNENEEIEEISTEDSIMEIQINDSNPLSQPMNGHYGKSAPTTFVQNTGNELHTVSDPPPETNQMALVNPEYLINSTDWEYRNGSYWCPMEGCNFKTANKWYTAGHERTHTGERPFKCDLCEKAFAHKQGLRYHLKKDHRGKKSRLTLPGGVLNMTGSVGAWAGQEPPPPPESKFKWIPKGGGFWQCPMCDFKTKNKWYKSGHERTHTGEKPFQCPHCPKAFAHRPGLQTHLTIHTGELRFQCVTCTARFRCRSSLNRHMLTHLKLYKCEQCEEKFKTPKKLARHIDIVHTGKKARASLVPKITHTPTHDLNTRANNSPLAMIGFDISTNQMNAFTFSMPERNGVTVLGNLNNSAEASNHGISIMELSTNE